MCPSSRIADLAAELLSPIAVSVVVPDGPAAVPSACESATAAGLVSLAALEVPLGSADQPAAAARLADTSASVPAAVPVYAEVAWHSPPGELEETLDVLAASGMRAKIRTGGLEAAAFPDETHLACVLVALCDRGLAFKCTAGLHGAVRRRGRTGFEQMGFANVLLATAAARSGAGKSEVERLLGERDEERVARAVARLDPSVRACFVSFGTCSVNEPVEDLARLGLLVAEGSPIL